MDASYQNVNRSRFLGTLDQFLLNAQSVNVGKCLLVALGIITIIGGLVATGCLYSRLGYSSFAIGGAGLVLGILCFVISKYCKPKRFIDTLTKDAEKEDDAYLIDFSKVNPSNIFEIFKNGRHFSHYGGVEISDEITYDESSKFKHNFPHKYSIAVVTVEKNEFGYNTSNRYTFTMNDEGKVESYGKVFDNFDLYIEHLQNKRIYSDGNFLDFEHFDFHSVTNEKGEPKKLRKKSSSSTH